MRFWIIAITSLIFLGFFGMYKGSSDAVAYKVHKLSGSMKIDGDWNKPQWKGVEAVEINQSMANEPAYHPTAKAKVLYDDQNIYVIFQVKDRYVRSVVTETQGQVYNDSCVEFFFSPDANAPLNYFNIETNCGGTKLMEYHNLASKKWSSMPIADVNNIEIAHSMPRVVDPQIDSVTTWTLEYRVPIATLKKFAKVTQPGKGVTWKANFYKLKEKGFNIHYKTWSVIQNVEPDFHLPQFFGTLNFQ
jgi:hypothetical protein